MKKVFVLSVLFAVILVAVMTLTKKADGQGYATSPVFISNSDPTTYAVGNPGNIMWSTTSSKLFTYVPNASSPSGFGWMPTSTGTAAYNTFCSGTVGSGTTEYPFIAGGIAVACSSNGTATGGIIVTSAGTVKNFYVTLGSAGAGGTGKDLFTLLKGGTTTGLTCNSTTTTACHDTTHTATVAAGDILTVSMVTATSDTAANIDVAFEKQ